ncbi:L,D-transpeptidase [Rhizomonospora bruguierae]|uniref:L,D-transpeptidase n=1 Tax=Rhizomonospora bruguierae TaxID=1581705 RepID=UPI001BCD35E9|nr:L,D-transpeptidase [Micromonospora sp. NBRC 107566]
MPRGERVTGTRRGGTLRGAVGFGVAVALGLTLLTGCSGGGSGGGRWQGGSGGTGGQGGTPSPTGPQVTAMVSVPGAEENKVSTAVEISYSSELADKATIEVKDAAGAAVKGGLRQGADDTAGVWVPAKQLKYGATYTATVTATAADGQTNTATSTFTTMAKPSKTISVSSFLGENQVVGVAMPIIIRFSRSIPKSYRDDVQKRMWVTADEPVTGIWRWASGTEVRFRPEKYWKANTKISYRIATGGLALGDGYFGRNDLTVDVKIGSELIMTVENKTKHMTVKKDGKVLRSIPISLGKPSTPSSSGTMVIIQKLRHTIFDTYDELGPEDGYRTPIDFAQRLTWGGQFIHAAPWSVSSQGRTNVSHGCVNMSMSQAEWLFGVTKMGDPITVKGTTRKLADGDGWTDWNVSFSTFAKGSALPLEEGVKAIVPPTPMES